MAEKSRAVDATSPSTPAGSDTSPAESVRPVARDVERLRAAVARLEAKVLKREKKAAKWKARAKAERTRAAKLEAALRRATAERPVDHLAATARDLGDVPITPPVIEQPDVSWTVDRLRTVARDAGVVGASRMTKAQLLAALDA